MKKLMVAAALALPLAAFNVSADDSMHGLLEESLTVIKLTDQDLDSVKGTYWGWGGGEFCFACSNTALVTQLNISLGSLGAVQSNDSYIQQGNN